jgi:hypothetical protein
MLIDLLFHLCFPHSALHKARLRMHVELGKNGPLLCNFYIQILMCTHSFHSTTQWTFLPCAWLPLLSGLFSPFPAVKGVHYFSTIQMWKQLTGIEYPLWFTYGVRYKIMTSKGPSYTLLRSWALLANIRKPTMLAELWKSRWQEAGE